MKRFMILLAAAVLALVSSAWADAPKLINFQGRLADGSGNPVADGSYSVTFRIYNAPIGGSLQWSETQTVSTTGGIFNALLGSATTLPGTVFDDTTRYLAIQVSPDPEMTPRQRLATVGYSFASNPWSTLGSDVFKLNGNVGIGEINPTAKLQINGDLKFSPSNMRIYAPYVGTIRFENPPAQVGHASIQLSATAANGRIYDVGSYADGVNPGSFRIYDRTAAIDRLTVDNSGNVGIGTTTPLERFHLGGGSGTGGIFVEGSVNNFDHLDGRSAVLLDTRTEVPDRTARIATPSGYGIAFFPAKTERVRIDSIGNVGIGTTSPSQKLDVAGTVQATGFKLPTGASNGFVLTSNASGVGTWQAASGGASGWADDGAVVRLTTGSDAVGIGTAAPTKKLEVAGSIKVGANDTVFSSNLSSNSPLSLQAPAGTTRMYIDDVTGNVGIGNTSPYAKLEVRNSTSSASQIYGITGFGENTSTGDAYGGNFQTSSFGTGTHYGAFCAAQSSSGSSAYGVYGAAYHTSTGAAVGGYFTTSSFAGTGYHYGVIAEGSVSSSSSAIGCSGSGYNPSTGDAYGGRFLVYSDGTGTHYGVRAEANGASSSTVIGSQSSGNNTSTGSSYGGDFYTTSSGTGLHVGLNAFGNGASSSSTYGSYSSAFNSSTGNTYGSYGNSFNSSTGTAYGGYFSGSSSSGTGYGVYSTGSYTGVFGTGPIGVYGYSPSGSGYGVFADGGAGYGIYALGSTYAGYFVGNTTTTGTKSAAVKVDNGEYRTLYAQESPENWFEDFGKAQLVNGRAIVNIEPLYLQTVSTSLEYHVFLTPEGDCRGLYVTNKTPNSFEIRELQNGKSELPVSYRIVAKRKGYENVRLAKLAGPTPEELRAEQEKRQSEMAKEKARHEQEQAVMAQERTNLEKERAQQEIERKQMEEERVKMEQERQLHSPAIKPNDEKK